MKTPLLEAKTVTRAKLKGYVFVIKASGMPRIDKPIEVPAEAWDTLTLKQQIYSNDQVVGVLRKAIRLGVYHGSNTSSRRS